MQNPDQFSQKSEKPAGESGAEQSSQPLYEFPTPYSSWPEAGQEAPQNMAGTAKPDASATPQPASEVAGNYKPPMEDLIRQGLVYPPPPSFYNQPQASFQQPLPPAYPTPMSMQPPPAYNGIQPPPAAYNGIQPPPPFPVPTQQPPMKKSYKWLWITISIVLVLLLAACGVCGWAISQFIAPIAQSETNAINVTNEYYTALQNKDYAGAYQYLLPQGPIQGITQETFTARAQSADNQYGTVRSYTTGPVGVVTDTNSSFSVSRFTITMNITRPGKSYNVLLTVTKNGNDWKITEFDGI